MVIILPDVISPASPLLPKRFQDISSSPLPLLLYRACLEAGTPARSAAFSEHIEATDPLDSFLPVPQAPYGMKTVLLGVGILLCGLVLGPALPARQPAADPFLPSNGSRGTQDFQGRRPPDRATVDAARRWHILYGDATGGGHRAGTGIKNKSEFPAGWSDDRIIREIESVANDPASTRTVQPNGRIRMEGSRDGVGIRVIIAANGTSIVTAHPINVPRSP